MHLEMSSAKLRLRCLSKQYFQPQNIIVITLDFASALVFDIAWSCFVEYKL